MRTAGGNIFTFYQPTKVVHGAHSVENVGGEFKALGGTKALIVTDQGVKNAGLIDGVLASLEKSGIESVVFDQVEEDPGGTTVGKGASLALERGCDGVIVVGGGSPICAARGIAVVATNGGRVEDYAGMNMASKPPLPVIAIPTTAGSGTEVSQFIVLKDEQLHTKMVAGSPLYFPKTAILDPLLLQGLSFRQFAVSGVDALGHAIEAYLTNLCTPITDAWALEAVGMMYRNLRQASTTDDLDAKEACLIGSTVANMACGNARLGLAHTMTTPLEGMFKVPHGIAIGVLLPHVMEFNLPASQARFAALARAMGQNDCEGTTEEIAYSAITALKKLLVDLDFIRSYREAGVDRAAIPNIARIVMGGLYAAKDMSKEYPPNAIVPSANIRKATMSDIIKLFEKAWEGWEL